MLYVFYTAVLFLLTVYSYSQIDLNLTLSSNKFYQAIQSQLIFLGYYNRPLSTGILILLLIFLYLIYLRILYLVNKNKLSKKKIIHLTVISSVILFFAYSAFSHDLFNYMFDARIVTEYYQNPYINSALDFPDDLWTRFMHWTHRTYPYGPIWLILTLPFSFLGFGKFVLTLFNFKLMFVIFHLGNVYLIYKILAKINPKSSLLGTAIYAFNPVILIESLVSPHNEVMMLFFLLLSIQQIFVKNNKLLGIISLLLSGGIKFVTLILLPLLPFVENAKKSSVWFMTFLVLISMTLIAEILYREPYSWYFIPVLGLGALLIKYPSINILISGFSLAAFLRYLPFLYMGDYSKSVKNLQDLLFIIVIVLTFLSVTLKLILKKLKISRALSSEDV